MYGVNGATPLSLGIPGKTDIAGRTPGIRPILTIIMILTIPGRHHHNPPHMRYLTRRLRPLTVNPNFLNSSKSTIRTGIIISPHVTLPCLMPSGSSGIAWSWPPMTYYLIRRSAALTISMAPVGPANSAWKALPARPKGPGASGPGTRA